MLKEACSDCVLGQNSSKSLYNLLLDSDDHVIQKSLQILPFYRE
jgi:hypothetical protein